MLVFHEDSKTISHTGVFMTSHYEEENESCTLNEQEHSDPVMLKGTQEFLLAKMNEFIIRHSSKVVFLNWYDQEEYHCYCEGPHECKFHIGWVGRYEL